MSEAGKAWLEQVWEDYDFRTYDCDVPSSEHYNETYRSFVYGAKAACASREKEIAELREEVERLRDIAVEAHVLCYWLDKEFIDGKRAELGPFASEAAFDVRRLTLPIEAKILKHMDARKLLEQGK